MIVVGIDIAKHKFDAVIRHPDGKTVHKVFENTSAGFKRFKRWLGQHGAKRAPVCMEATGYYYLPLADFLHEATYPVHVVNPNRIKAYADSQLSHNKTDKLDAALIADFCQSQRPPCGHRRRLSNGNYWHWYDATMTSSRPFKRSKTASQLIFHLRRCSSISEITLPFWKAI